MNVVLIRIRPVKNAILYQEILNGRLSDDGASYRMQGKPERNRRIGLDAVAGSDSLYSR
jgi:hypothetical protein